MNVSLTWNLKLDNSTVPVYIISYPSLLSLRYLKLLRMGVVDVKVLYKILYTPYTIKTKKGSRDAPRFSAN
jgi:hypothetical protein